MKRLISIAAAILIICSVLMGVVCAEPEAAAKFSDVKETDWYAEAVGRLNALKIIDGLPDGSFNPQGEITRAQFVKMLVQAMEYKKVDSISFDDIKRYPSSKPHWASVYIETALRNDVIVKEEIGDNFYPDVPLTREDMLMMMFRALNLEPSDGADPYYDIDEPNGYFTKLYEEYLVRGIPMNGKVIFNPTGVTTRAEAAVIISRMVDYKADPKGYVARMAMEERFTNGTYTEEDLAKKKQMDIEMQEQDRTYIPDPIIRYVYNPSKGIYARAILVNADVYGSDISFRRICTSHNDLNRMGSNDIYGHYSEVDMTRWFTSKEAKASFIAVSRWNAKLINGHGEYYENKFIAGTKVNFKLYIKRGKNTNESDIVFTIQ